jgi:hypothetical protein
VDFSIKNSRPRCGITTTTKFTRDSNIIEEAAR